MKELKKDMAIATLFVFGMIGFMVGEFVISTVFYASAAMLSNIHLNSSSSP